MQLERNKFYNFIWKKIFDLRLIYYSNLLNLFEFEQKHMYSKKIHKE